MALTPLRSKASNSSWRWARVKRSRPSVPARMMEESEGAGSDGVDCIRDYVCSRCPRLASGCQLSAYPDSATSTVLPCPTCAPGTGPINQKVYKLKDWPHRGFRLNQVICDPQLFSLRNGSGTRRNPWGDLFGFGAWLRGGLAFRRLARCGATIVRWRPLSGGRGSVLG